MFYTNYAFLNIKAKINHCITVQFIYPAERYSVSANDPFQPSPIKNSISGIPFSLLLAINT